MILPIVAYGDPVLKLRAEEVKPETEGVKEFIADLWETMYNAKGVGLAAPQVGRSWRIFVIDASAFAEEEESLADFKKVFINPQILDEEGSEWPFNEGCLSIPGIREDVRRKPVLRMKYQDEDFQPREEEFDGIAARIIQHEYDHLEGVLFTDRIGAFKRRLLRRKLDDISKGIVSVEYRMKFPLKKGR